ncbi:MAG: FeoA family protein [Burkholderiaceae bacterium]
MALFDLHSTVFTSSPETLANVRASASISDHPAAIALSDLPVGGFATIHAVLPTDNDGDRDLVMRLIEIGFVPGERVRVIAQGHPGRQPIAVRLAATDSGRRTMSGSTFAMRRHEADFIRVVPDLPVGDAG